MCQEFCPQVGGCIPACIGQGCVYPSMDWTGVWQTLTWADTPPRADTSPKSRHTLQGRHPRTDTPLTALLLLAANEVMFLHVSVILSTGEGHVWWGGGMHGRGHAWQGGMRGRGRAWWGTCMVHMPPLPDTPRYGDTVNERSVCILLECILIWQIF